jgi:hypothetical protein
LFVLVFEELTTVVGLLGQRGEIDAKTGKANRALFGQKNVVGLGAFVGVTGEASTGNRFAGGVLEAG